MRIPLFDALKLPMRGQMSSVDQAAVPIGRFRRISNFILNRLLVTLRWGCALLNSSPIVASAGFRGAAIVQLAGANFLFVACRVSSETRIYQVTLGGFVGTELTAAAGTFGNTRFSTDGFVDFAAFYREHPLLSAAWLVVCSNGKDSVRVINYDGSTALTSSRLSVGSDITLPTAQNYYSQPTFTHWILVKDSAATAAFTNSGANLVGVDSGASATENQYNYTFNAAAAVGDTSIINWTGTFAYQESSGSNVFNLGPTAGARQLIIVIEEALANVDDPSIDYLQVEVNAGAVPAYQTIFDPTQTFTPTPETVEISRDATNVRYAAAFEVPASTLFDFTLVTNMRFTVKKKPAANRTFSIIAIMAGGMVQGARQHAVGYQRSNSMVESALVPCRSLRSNTLAEVGGSRQRLDTLPNDNRLYFRYKVAFADNAGSGDKAYAMFYALDTYPDENSDSGFISDDWFYLTGTYQGVTSGGYSVKTDDIPAPSKYYTVRAPSFRHYNIPKAASLLSANSRMYCAGINGKQSDLWISDYNYPLRFGDLRLDNAGAIDDTGPTINRFGGETTQKVIGMPGVIPGSEVGFSPALLFTDKRVWMIAGKGAGQLSQQSLASSNGTIFPGTISTHRTFVYYADSFRVPRALAFGQDDQRLGVNEIEDEFADNDLSAASSISYQDRWYVALKVSGGSANKRIVLYDEPIGGFHRHDYTTPDFAGLLTHVDSSTSRILGFTAACYCYQLEQPAKLSDDKVGGGTDTISGTLHTGGMRWPDKWQKWFMNQVQVLMDKSVNGSIATTRVDLVDSANAGRTTGTIDLDDLVADKVYRTDIHSEGAEPGIETAMARLEIVITADPGKYIQELAVYGELSDAEADQ
jgi:hypothetical protein